jgi:hypothetical protein
LEEYLKSGDKVYTVLRGAPSSSGMTRYISLMVAGLDSSGNPAVFDITWHAARVLTENLVEKNGHRAIKVSGAGMDMGFHLVYNLSSVLFAGQERAGYELKQAWL